MCSLYIVFGIAFLLCIVRGQDEYKSNACYNPPQNVGQCISLDNCEQLKPLAKQSREKLMEYHCGGWQSNVPMVCCPSSTTVPATVTVTPATVTSEMSADACVTVDGKFGLCLPLANCLHIKKMLSEKTKGSLNYYQRSRCLGQTNTDVCCDTKIGPSTALVSRDGACPESAFPPDPQSQCCGTEGFSGNKIIGGKEAAIDQYPWLALLQYSRPYVCGGSLISNKYVLTAAHCVLNKSNKPLGLTAVILGEFNTSNSGPDCVQVEGGGEDCTLGPERVPVESVITHPEYNTHAIVQYANDIALLRLTRMVTFNDFIKPICLPSSDVSISPPDDMILYVSGWGAVNATRATSDVKLYTSLPFVNNKQCRSRFNTIKGSIVWEKQICAGGEINKDTCKGDSGGPLMYERGNSHEVIGIVSFGVLQCGLKTPSVYTKVYDYLSWINASIKT